SLNKVMDGFIPDILAKSAIKLHNEGAEWSGLKDAVYSAITVKGDVSELYKAFGTHWLKSGKEARDVSEVKDRIQWDYIPLKDQLIHLEKYGGLWGIAENQRNRLISQVLEKQPPDFSHNMLEKIIYAVANGDAALRENAARTLEFIASSFETSSISKEARKQVVKSLVANFGREPEAQIIASAYRGLIHAITAYIKSNEFSLATEILAALDRCCASGPPTSSKARLVANIKSHLCARANVEPVIQSYFELGADYFNGTALPWLKALGVGAVEFLMEMLSEESDRRRRGQIMDSIRSFGNDILSELVKYLDSGRWYVVRNTLILIAEMADQSCYAGVVKCLQHPDLRVKKTAARTLWRGFGKQAVGPFLRIINDAEPEIFEEILFGLAHIPAPEAIPAALGYAVETNNPDRLRAMALNVLVANPSRESLPVLIEFVKRKGRIITTAEPLEIRIAAAKAMAACGQEGRDKLIEIVNSEPSGVDRDELSRILES
ncbi:MAG: HEAT repeat domain-containing protein, partial [Holophagales bacterium]|nr:HEAT repeat domain-containing protein [Holophagales bacterium]